MKYDIVSFDTLNSFLINPFNDPKLDPNYSENDFFNELEQTNSLMKKRLELLGDSTEGKRGDADFEISKEGGITRCVAITLMSRKLWNKDLIPFILSALDSLPKSYLVYIDTCFDLEEAIFILISRDFVLGSSDNPQWLVPFGFSR